MGLKVLKEESGRIFYWRQRPCLVVGGWWEKSVNEREWCVNIEFYYIETQSEMGAGDRRVLSKHVLISRQEIAARATPLNFLGSIWLLHSTHSSSSSDMLFATRPHFASLERSHKHHILASKLISYLLTSKAYKLVEFGDFGLLGMKLSSHIHETHNEYQFPRYRNVFLM